MKWLYCFLFSCLILATKGKSSANPSSSSKYSVFTRQICSNNPIDKVFNLLTNNKHNTYKLKNADSSAVLLRLTLNSSSYKKFPDKCDFIIDGERISDGFFLNIHSLNLRRNEETGECYDYVLIKDDEDHIDMICDKIGMENMPQMKSITINKKRFSVLIHIDRRRPFKESNDKLDISMVFTAYRECMDRDDEIACVPDNKQSCISRSYYKDGLVNCPANYCTDEEKSFIETHKTRALDTSNIAISAITSFIFTSVALITCLWFCWKYKECAKLCVHGANERDNNVQHPTNIELPTSSDNLRSEPTAPPIDEDKDLPPSYESLFLEQKANG